MPPLVDARLKVRRAEENLKRLEAEIAEFRKTKPYTFVPDHDGKTGEELLRFKITATTPEMWPAQISEVVHLLRTALDNAIYRLRYPTGQTPGSRILEFPIFLDRDDYFGRRGGAQKIKGIRDDVRAIVEEFQPWQFKLLGRNPELQPLWVLHELDRWDKHSLPHPTLVRSGAGDFRLTPPSPPCYIFNVELITKGLIEDGAIVARYLLLTSAAAECKVNVKGQIAYGVAFDEAGPAKGAFVIEGLNQIGKAVDGIISRLEKLPP